MRLRVCVTLLIAALLSACGNIQPPPPAPPTPTAPAASTATIAPTEPSPPTSLPTATDTVGTATPSAAVTETPAAGVTVSNVLPAPVLFLSDQSGNDQIWRVAADGSTLAQLTQEITAVTGFDVSPLDGRLIYVSGNDLVVANADGSGRVVLVDGPPQPAVDANDRINLEMRQPRWSPDGSRITYGLNGVNVVDAATGVTATLKQSDPVPQPPDYQSEGPVKFYWPNSWSPDGTRILVEFAYFPEAGGLAVLTVTDKTMVDIVSPEGIVCCSPAWSTDGTALYYANAVPGMIAPGLWQADASTGQSTTLITGVTQSEWHLVAYPKHAPDGTLYYFYATHPLPGQETEPMPGYVPLSMHRSRAGDLATQTKLRDDAHVIGEALWSPDASGAIIVDAQASSEANSYPLTGTLLYLKTDGSPAIELPGKGHMPRWGAQAPASTDATIDEPILLWEGHTEMGDGDTSTCKSLRISVDGQAGIGACGDGASVKWVAFQSQEWRDIVARFAPFEYSNADEHVVFRGQGKMAGKAWQRAIATWTQFTYGELSSGRVSAASRTVLSWWLGELPDQPGYCAHLVVLAYGYAYHNIDTCKGGGEPKLSAGGWLETGEWEPFDAWLYGRMPLSQGDNYFSGLGSQELTQDREQRTGAMG